MRRLLLLALAAVSLGTPLLVRADEPESKPTTVAAIVDTTLTTASQQIRQFAFDGAGETFFASEEIPRANDHFTLVFDRPVALKSVSVVTGRPDGSDKLESGVLEVAPDGKTFTELAKISGGEARAEGSGKEVQAIRIRTGDDQKQPLVVREITIDASPQVAVFQYPVEFVVNVSDAPEMRGWAEEVARLCERWYPRINDEFKSEGYKPAHVVTMTLSKSYNGVAAAGGGRITGSVKFFKAHPDDVGAMIHETTHIVQRYRGRNNPGWLVEGVADYFRFFKFEPGRIGRLNTSRARYDGSYRVTAAFLDYVTETYDKQLVPKLNVMMREGTYKEEVFKELTGKTLQELDEDWRKSIMK